VVGGSTITQQLAKNLFLSKERNFVRKGQEFAITFMLEGLLSKDRILDIYLNNVEWGEGVFGIQAAARNYYRVDASQLSATQAGRLAVMLPAPKRYEKTFSGGYVVSRGNTIAARLGDVELP
jgi:monofunctional biosynthetic peptidoglycan transglycosylase